MLINFHVTVSLDADVLQRVDRLLDQLDGKGMTEEEASAVTARLKATSERLKVMATEPADANPV